MYSPKIYERHIPTLYFIAKSFKKPMTRIVNEIIERAIKEIKPDELDNTVEVSGRTSTVQKN